MILTYKFLNPSLEKYYYGYTTQSKVRWHQHILSLEGNRHHCKELQEVYNGDPKGWKFEVHKVFDTEDKGLKYEKNYIFNNRENLLNSNIPVKNGKKIVWSGNGGVPKSEWLFKIGDKIKYKEYDCLTIIGISSTQYLVEEEGNIISIWRNLLHKYGSKIN